MKPPAYDDRSAELLKKSALLRKTSARLVRESKGEGDASMALIAEVKYLLRAMDPRDGPMPDAPDPE
jgi:hypothetical protein